MNLRAVLVLLSLPFFVLVPLPALAIDSVAGPYHLTVTTDPAVVPVGNAKLFVHIDNSAGKPVDGATVKVLAQMPSMPMGEREQTATPVPGTPGTYQAPVVFAMAGGYDAHVTITGPGGSAKADIPLQTGQSTRGNESGGFPTAPVLEALTLLAIIVILMLRLRKLGVKARVSGRSAGQIAGGLVVLGLVIGATVWAVGANRRPGSMTPLEAQGMEMNTPPPPGSLAVSLATVRRGTIESTVRYTGQAVGFVEQDVFPRVTGTLTYMPLYVGDHVRRGQVIARIDTTQLAPQVADKRAMQESARQGLASAEADLQVAGAMVDQAEAEHGQYMSGIEEAKANLSAAKEGEASMAAQVTAANAEAQSAVARRNSARADENYWRQELDRTQQLFSAKAVSRSEYQQAVAQEAKTRAAFAEAQSDLAGVNAKALAASAADRQAKDAVTAAMRKLDEAQSEMLVHRAHVVMQTAEKASAVGKVGQAAAQLNQAKADVDAAVANEAYATITSPIDGVVTQRNVTQGTLVQPGQAILRLAQIDPIRLQANVPVADLEKVQLGSRVRIRTSSNAAEDAAITSISPSVDPVARTGVVEALVQNPSAKLLPGQFDSMTISTGTLRGALIVPNDAIQESEGGSYVWVATPSGAGQYTVHRVLVHPGATDGTGTVIPGGLSKGDAVVTSGFINLEDGSSVTGTQEAQAGVR